MQKKTLGKCHGKDRKDIYDGKYMGKDKDKTRPFSLSISDPNPFFFENFNLKSSLYFVLALNPWAFFAFDNVSYLKQDVKITYENKGGLSSKH